VKLFNTIVIWDCYVVAESSEDARKELLAAITEGEAPSEVVGSEVTREAAIRASWLDQRPFVAGEVSVADRAKIKGKTTTEIFQQLYTKQAK